MIAYGSLYPWHFVARELGHSPLWILFHSWSLRFDRFIFRDIVINVMLYVPAGITGHLAFRKFRRPWLAFAGPILIGAVWSASIEMIQLFDPPRDCSAIDLLNNIAGCGVGVLLAIVLENHFLPTGKPPDRSALALLACWTVWLLFPLFPVLGRTVLLQKLSLFTQFATVDSVPFVSAVFCWFAVGSLFSAGGLRPVRRLLAISVLLIPAQFFMVDRQPVFAELLGAVGGAALFALLWRQRNTYQKPLAWAFLGLLVFRGCAPFTFVPAAEPFWWIPFQGFLSMDWQAGVQSIAEKFFWYGTAIWLMLATGMRVVVATAMVAAILLVIEVMQTHLPGRTAEITDPLLAIFGGFVLATMDARRRKHA